MCGRQWVANFAEVLCGRRKGEDGFSGEFSCAVCVLERVNCPPSAMDVEVVLLLSKGHRGWQEEVWVVA